MIKLHFYQQILSAFALGTILMSAPVQALSQSSTLSIDEKPSPLEATPFTFPEFEEFTLENGLHVYVVENHDVPAVTFSLVLNGGDSFDPAGKEGATSIMGDMLLKGTKTRTALEIAQALDGSGASISTSVGSQSLTISGSALKKHTELLASILGEMLTQPTFDEKEIDKLREQYRANVASQRGNAMETAQALSRKVIYGFDHPVARRASEATISAITREDVLSVYNTYILPNNASIAIVGDITVKEVKQLLAKHLAKWKKGTAPSTTMPPLNTSDAGVYFIPRNGSVQSSVIVCAAAPGITSDEWIPMNVATSYFGSSFGSILFETLRETYSYTYSPFGYTTRGAEFNRSSLGAEVRSSVTDSAISVILRELADLTTNGPDHTKLERRVALLSGQYSMAMERPSTVASLLQNGWLSGLSNNDVATYADQLKRVSWGDVKEVSAKYLSSPNLRIVVVGSPEVRSKLEAFGTIYDYDVELQPAGATSYVEVDMDVEDVVEAYSDALGGEKSINNVSSIAYTGTINMMMRGNSTKGSAERKVMRPNKEYTAIDFPGMKQLQWFDGTNGWLSINNGAAGAMDANEIKEMTTSNVLFPALALTTSGWKCNVLGKKGSEIHVEAKTPTGKVALFVFDANTMLLDRIEKSEDTPQGPIPNTTKYADYKQVKGVKLPSTMRISNPMYTMDFTWEVVVNENVSETDFTPSN